MLNYKYHYVYRITNIKTKMYYYGDRSCNCQPLEDIGKQYFSSFTNKFFKIDQLNNPQDYKYKIIKIFKTCREDAKQLEVDLHKRFDVKNNPKFINRANQELSGFSFSDYNSFDYVSIGKKTKETRLKNNSYISGAQKGVETKTKMGTHTRSAKKAAITRRETICENGKSLQENTTKKIKNTMSIIGDDGKTKYQKQGEKLSKYLECKENNSKFTNGELRIQNLHKANKIIGYKNIIKNTNKTKMEKYNKVYFLIFNKHNELIVELNYYDFKNRIIEDLPYSRFKSLITEWKRDNGYNQKAIIDIPFKTKGLNILKGKNTKFNGYYILKEIRE